MKVVTDECCGISSPALLKPRTAYDAQVSTDGRIILTELTGAEVPVVRSRRVGGRLRGAVVPLTRSAVAAAVRADRDGR
jgi:hypothetical protein